MLAYYVGINLRSGYIIMPQELLHSSDICSAREEMSRKGVAKNMRVHTLRGD